MGASTIPKMTASDQMEEQILIVHLNLPVIDFSIVIFLVPLSPKTFNTLIYFYYWWISELAHKYSKPSG